MEGKIKGNKGCYEGWKMEVCIIKDMMRVAQNNKLEFQKPPKHHTLWGKGPHVEHLLAWHL